MGYKAWFQQSVLNISNLITLDGTNLAVFSLVSITVTTLKIYSSFVIWGCLLWEDVNSWILKNIFIPFPNIKCTQLSNQQEVFWNSKKENSTFDLKLQFHLLFLEVIMNDENWCCKMFCSNVHGRIGFRCCS